MIFLFLSLIFFTPFLISASNNTDTLYITAKENLIQHKYKKSLDLLKKINNPNKKLTCIKKLYIANSYLNLKKNNIAETEYLKIFFNCKNKTILKKTVLKLVDLYEITNQYNKKIKFLKILSNKYYNNYSYYQDIILDRIVKSDILFRLMKTYYKKKDYKNCKNTMKNILEKYFYSKASRYSVDYFKDIIKNKYYFLKDKEFEFLYLKKTLNKLKYKEKDKKLIKLLLHFIKTKNKKKIVEIRYLLGRINYRKKKYKKALLQFNIIKKYYITNKYAAKSIFYMGIIKYKQKKYKEFLKNMRLVLTNYPKKNITYSVFSELFSYYEENNKTKETIKLKKYMEKYYLNYKKYRLYLKSEWIVFLELYKNKKYKDAIKVLEKIKKIRIHNKNKYNLWYNKILLKQKKKPRKIKLKKMNNIYDLRLVQINNIKLKKQKQIKFDIRKKIKNYRFYNFLYRVKDYKLLYDFIVDDTKYVYRTEILAFLSKKLNKISESIFYSNQVKKYNIPFEKISYPRSYEKIIKKQTLKTKFDGNLPLAIIREESRFNKNCVSSAGAVGVMQLMPSTARFLCRKYKVKKYSYKKLFTPEFNIKLGVLELIRLMNYWKKNKVSDYSYRVIFSIASYNAGLSRVKSWKKKYFDNLKDIDYFIEKIPFKETHNYTKRVFYSYYKYSKQNNK